MQRRLVRKLDLNMFISQVAPHPNPKPNLEQYTIPADVAATMLYVAAYTYNDIIGKTVLDLGCGTGRLALAASFLDAKQVLGIDVDRTAINAASKNSVKTGLRGKVQWIASDISAVHGKFNTVLQNPPFGVQKRKADRKFLEKALETGEVVYSLHKSLRKGKTFIRKLESPRNLLVPTFPSPFLKNYIEEHNGKIRAVFAMLMTIPYTFHFHTKPKHKFVVDLYVIERK
jgi:putative methylase